MTSLTEHIQARLTGLDVLGKDSCLHNAPSCSENGVPREAYQLCEEEELNLSAGPLTGE